MLAAVTLIACQSHVLQRVLHVWLGRIFAVEVIWWPAAFLLAIGAGWAWKRRNPGPVASRWIAVAAIGVLGVSACAPLLAAGRLPEAWLRFLLMPGRTVGVHFVATAALVLAFGGLSFAAAGTLFEMLFRSRSWQGRRPPHVLSLILGFMLVSTLLPRLAVRIGLADLAAVAMIWSGVLAVGLLWRHHRLAALAAPVVAAAVIWIVPAPRVPILATAALPRWACRDTGFLKGGQLVRHSDASPEALSLFVHEDYGRVLTIDGRPVAFESRFAASRILSAHLPFLLAPRARTAALVGPDAPVALAHARLHPLTRIDCATDQPMLAAWAADFAAASTNPAAVRPEVVMKSAQASRVLKASAAYDVVLVAAAPGWMTGAARWLDGRMFDCYAKMLAPGGLAAVTVDTRGLSPALFRRCLRTFAARFAHVQVWCLGEASWVLIGSAREIKVPADLLLARLEQPEIFRDLAAGGVYALPELLACFVMDTRAVKAATAGLAPDSRFLLALDMVVSGPGALLDSANAAHVLAAVEPQRSWSMDWLLPGEMDLDVYVALLDRVGVDLGARARVAAALGRTARDAGAMAAALREAAPNVRDLLVREQADRLELVARRRLAMGDARSATRRYEELLAIVPDSAAVQYGMAVACQRSGQPQAAYWHFVRATALATDNIDYRLELARTAAQLGELGEAVRQYREAVRLNPNHAQALYRLARVLAHPKTPGRDVDEAVRLAERACVAARWSDYEMAIGLADLYLENGRVMDGVMLKRRLRAPRSPAVEAVRR
jgi:tetratricopeptide (TPR) repeat protein/spermidine synthase